jgi:hypothetical protein
MEEQDRSIMFPARPRPLAWFHDRIVAYPVSFVKRQEVCFGPPRDGTRARWSCAGGIRATLMQCVRSGRFKPEFVRRSLVLLR